MCFIIAPPRFFRPPIGWRVNRVLKAFRARNLITLSRGALRIDDIATLRKLAGFTEGHLHFDGAPEHIRRYLDERKKPQRRSSSG